MSDKISTAKGDARKQAIIEYLTYHVTSSAGETADHFGISPARV